MPQKTFFSSLASNKQFKYISSKIPMSIFKIMIYQAAEKARIEAYGSPPLSSQDNFDYYQAPQLQYWE